MAEASDSEYGLAKMPHFEILGIDVSPAKISSKYDFAAVVACKRYTGQTVGWCFVQRSSSYLDSCEDLPTRERISSTVSIVIKER